jgi:hypothetical protein
MITGFEKHTQPLTPDQHIVVKWLDDLFSGKTSYDVPVGSKPIKGTTLVNAISALFSLPKFGESTLRKCINTLRKTGTTPILSNSNGYYTTRDKDEIRKNIESLEQRANGILAASHGLKRFL